MSTKAPGSRTIRQVSRGVVVAIVCLLSTPVFAAPNEADVAFENGRKLLAAGKYDAACTAFERSLELDFQFGTLFNLADCNDKRGRLVASFTLWSRIATEDKNAGRAKRARELGAVVEKRIPRIVVSLRPNVEGARLTVDGAGATLTTPVLVDLGKHEVVVTLPDHRVLKRSVETAQESATETVEINTVIPLGPPLEPQDTPGGARGADAPEVTRHSGRVTSGKVLVVAGGATVVTGLVLGGLAMSGWSEAEDKAKTDVPGANDDLDRVRLLGNLSTGLIAVGVVSVGVGAYLWRSGSREVRATAAIRGGRASLGLVVSF